LSRSLKFQIVEQARALIVEETQWCRGDAQTAAQDHYQHVEVPIALLKLA